MIICRKHDPEHLSIGVRQRHVVAHSGFCQLYNEQSKTAAVHVYSWHVYQQSHQFKQDAAGKWQAMQLGTLVSGT